jgi:hypothetical protein
VVWLSKPQGVSILGIPLAMIYMKKMLSLKSSNPNSFGINFRYKSFWLTFVNTYKELSLGPFEEYVASVSIITESI